VSALYQYSPVVKNYFPNYFPNGIAYGKNGVTARDDDIPVPPDSHDESIARQPNLAQMEALERGTHE